MEGFYRDMVVSVFTGTLLGMLLSAVALMFAEVR